MNKIKTIFIGNRPNIYRAIVNDSRLDLVKAFIPSGSLLDEKNHEVIEVFNAGDSSKIVSYLKLTDYKLCISAGCPWILPYSELPQKNIFLNSHPSVLPFGKGRHPINECIFSNHQKFGATLHYLTDELDGGDIIEQKSYDVTEDLDLGLLYSFIFDLESEVFKSGLNKLIDANWAYIGQPQKGGGTYYSRHDADMTLNLGQEQSAFILKKIRAFSTRNQGILIKSNSISFKAFRAENINNHYVLARFFKTAPGEIIFYKKNDFILAKTLDGIIRISSWIE